jgi:tetratricopeptide (TPR) repeat protein
MRFLFAPLRALLGLEAGPQPIDAPPNTPGRSSALGRDALFERASKHLEAGEKEHALVCYEQILCLNPQDIEALRQGSELLVKMTQWNEATEWGLQLLTVAPEDIKALRALGSAARNSGRLADAERVLREGLQKHPQDPGLLTELGWTLRELDRYAEAEACFSEAQGLSPDIPIPSYGLIAVLQETGREEEAALMIDHLLLEYPDNASLLLSKAAHLKKEGNFEAARDACYRAMQAAPGRPEPWANIVPLLARLGCREEAIECGQHAIALDPHCAAAHLNLAMTLLPLGRFAQGWRHYQWRFQIMLRRSYPFPLVPGKPMIQRPEDLLPLDLHNRKITLIEDQGLGDEISFLRFAPLLRSRGAHVTYMPDPRLAAMVERANVVDRIAGSGEDAPVDTEIYLASGDMPLVLEMGDADPLPPPLTLLPLPEKRTALRQRLQDAGLAGKRLIGLTWRGGQVLPRGRALFKEISLESLSPLLRNVPAEVLILQRKPQAGEIDEVSRILGRTAHDFTDLNDDLEGMLALLDELEDYVTVSNTNVHLRIGLRKPCRVLVPNPPDYRWMISGDTSPWFPGARVYRQCVGGDWSPALDALATDLRDAFQ